MSKIWVRRIKDGFPSYWRKIFPKTNTGLDAEPVKNVVHLVSLEGLTEYLDGSKQIKESKVQLISLASWFFNSIPALKENFEQLAEQLVSESKNHFIRLPLPNEEQSDESQEVHKKISMGYVPVKYTRLWRKHCCMVSGPLSPTEVPIIDNMTPDISFQLGQQQVKALRQADGYAIYDTKFGTFDHSYSAAWNLGRLLAMADKDFIQALMELRGRCHREARSLMAATLARTSATLPQGRLIKKSELVDLKEVLVSELKGRKPDESPNSGKDDLATNLVKVTRGEISLKNFPPVPGVASKPNSISLQREVVKTLIHTAVDQNEEIATYQPWYDKVKQWLLNLRQLNNVPFHFLIANSAFYLKSPLRFFHIDPNWLEALTAGALSVGVQSDIDQSINNSIKKALTNLLQEADPKSGVIISSPLILGWPGLVVQPKSNNNNNVTVSRKEKLASNILLSLFNDIPSSVTLSEPMNQISFGITGAETGLMSGFVDIRSIAGDNIGKVIDKINVNSVKQLLRSDDNRVLNLTNNNSGLCDKFKIKLEKQLEGKQLTSSQFALQMLNAAESVVFNLQPIIPIANRKYERMIAKPLALPSVTPSKLIYKFITPIIQIGMPTVIAWAIEPPPNSPYVLLDHIKINLPEGAINSTDGPDVLTVDSSENNIQVKALCADGLWRTEWQTDASPPVLLVYSGNGFNQRKAQPVTQKILVSLTIKKASSIPSLNGPITASVKEITGSPPNPPVQVTAPIFGLVKTPTFNPLSDLYMFSRGEVGVGWPNYFTLNADNLYLKFKWQVNSLAFNRYTVTLYQENNIL